MNPKLTPLQRVILLAGAFLLPTQTAYFVFFTLPHHGGASELEAYGIVCAGIALGAALISLLFSEARVRLLIGLTFSVIALLATWLAAIYVACHCYGSCP
jgi:hypothetical protein